MDAKKIKFPKFRLLPLFILTLFLSASPIYAENNEQSQASSNEMMTPDPMKLDPHWKDYFETDQKTLEKRTEALNELLALYVEKLESKEEKIKAQNLVKQIDSQLKSLIHLKIKPQEKPTPSRLIKNSYSLEDYLELSDSIRDLELEITRSNSEIESYRNSVANISQNLNNEYATYLLDDEKPINRFMKGLEIIALGTRLIYYNNTIQFMKLNIKAEKIRQQNQIKEFEFLKENAKLNIDKSLLEKRQKEIEQQYSKIHEEVLITEAQSIPAYSSKEGLEATQVINQKLINALIQEALLKSKIILIKAINLLSQQNESKVPQNYSSIIDTIQEFINKADNQVGLWRTMLTEEFDRLSKPSMMNLETKDDHLPTKAFTENLKILITSKVALDSLSRELNHIHLVLNLINKKIIEEKDLPNRAIFDLKSKYEELKMFFGDWFNYSLLEIGDIPITFMNILKALFIIIIAIFVSKTVRLVIRRISKKKGRGVEPTIYVFQRIIHYCILVIGIMFALGSLGLTMQNFTIILGALGIGVGFGLQNIVNNFLCGLTILFERNVKVGDYIEFDSGHFGKVIEVNVQSCTIHSFDGVDILVPNSTIVGNKVTNWTKKDPYLRIHVPFGVAYESDQDKVKEVVIEASEKIPYTITNNPSIPKPEVWLVNLGESSLDFELVVWVNFFKSRGRSAMKAAYLSEIIKALKSNNIKIPFPQRDIYLKATLPETREFCEQVEKLKDTPKNIDG